MSSTASDVQFVQNDYTDNWTRGYPGQVVDTQTMIGTGLDTYAAEADIVMGRGVVRATSQFQESSSNAPFVVTAPFTITVPVDGAPPAASDLVGVAVRPYITTTNLVVNGKREAGYIAKSMASVLPFGSQKAIMVRGKVGVDYAVGDPVYIAIDPTNDPVIELGEFMTAADGVTGLLLVPNAQFWINKTATVNDTIVVIKLF